MNKPCLFSLISAPLLFVNVEAIELSKHLSTATEPVPKVRSEPKYPISAAKSSREGWARFSFIIEKDGSVSNIISTENSGSKDITLAAKKALMKWQYEPAMENGEPIQQCVNSVQMDFRIDGIATPIITRRFKSLYVKVQKSLEQKAYDKVEENLTKLKKFKYLHLTENNFLQLLLAQYAKETGDEAKQLSHLYKVKFSPNDESNLQQLSVLQQRFGLEIKLNRFQQAFSTFKQIEKNKLAQPNIEQYQKIIKQVDEFINSDQNLVVNANIRDKEYWHYPLTRNEFSLTNIEGKLSKMDIRCANKRHVYTVEENNTWQIPEAWQQCNIFIFGENDTKFTVVEHPFKV